MTQPLSRPFLDKLRVLLFASCSLLLVANVQAEERPLDAPRAQGLIGERFDGYAVVHDTQAAAGVQALVTNTNNERRKVYEKQAGATNAPVAEVGKIYAGEIRQKAPAGTWFQGADGRWSQK